jgi:hypothetical protein
VPGFELNDLGHMNRLGDWDWISARVRSALVRYRPTGATFEPSSAVLEQRATLRRGIVW